MFRVDDEALINYVKECQLRKCEVVGPFKTYVFQKSISVDIGSLTVLGILKIENTTRLAIEYTEGIRTMYNNLQQYFSKNFKGKFTSSLAENYKNYPPHFLPKINGKTKFYSGGEIVQCLEKKSCPKKVDKIVLQFSGIYEGPHMWGFNFWIKECHIDQREVKEAEEEVKIANEELCTICMDSPISFIFLPCGHLCSCESCSTRCSTCPICRKEITQKNKVFKV